MSEKKKSFGKLLGGGAGEAMQLVVDTINTIFVDYRVTTVEMLLIGLALIEGLQGVLSNSPEIVEASRGARMAGHVGLFLVGLVAGLIYAKEVSDIVKAAKKAVDGKGSIGNVFSQLIQALVVVVLMLISVIGQTVIVLGVYGVSKPFMEMFLRNPIEPLIGMLEYGAFATMTVYIAYLHFLALIYVGFKQLGDEDFSSGKKSNSGSPKGNSGNNQGSGDPITNLYSIIQRFSPGLDLSSFRSYVNDSKEAENFTKWLNNGGDRRDKSLAILEYVGLTNQTALSNTYKREIDKALGKP